MKAIDTNVLIRFLVRDDAQQEQAVFQLFKNTEKNQAEEEGKSAMERIE